MLTFIRATAAALVLALVGLLEQAEEGLSGAISEISLSQGEKVFSLYS